MTYKGNNQISKNSNLLPDPTLTQLIKDIDFSNKTFEDILENKGIALNCNPLICYAECSNDVDSIMEELELPNSEGWDKRKKLEKHLNPYAKNLKGRFLKLEGKYINLDFIVECLKTDSPRILQDDVEAREYYNMWKPFCNTIDTNILSKYSNVLSEMLELDSRGIKNFIETIRKQQLKFRQKMEQAKSLKRDKRKSYREKLESINTGRDNMYLRTGKEVNTCIVNLGDVYEQCFNYATHDLDTEAFESLLQKRQKAQNFIVLDIPSPMTYKSFLSNIDYIIDTLIKYNYFSVAGIEKTYEFNMSPKSVKKQWRCYIKRIKGQVGELSEKKREKYRQQFNDEVLPSLKAYISERRAKTKVREQNIQATLIKNTGGRVSSYCNGFVTSPQNKVNLLNSEGKVKDIDVRIPGYKAQHIFITKHIQSIKDILKYQIERGKLGILNIMHKLRGMYVKDTTDKIKTTLWCLGDSPGKVQLV